MVLSGGIFGTPGGMGTSGTVGMTGPQGNPGPSGASGLQGPAGAGGDHVDARPVSGSIIPDTHAVYDIGASGLRYAELYSVSGIFGSGGNLFDDTISSVSISNDVIVNHNAASGRGIIINEHNASYADTALLIDIDRVGSTAFNAMLVLTNNAADPIFQIDGQGKILNRALRVDPLDTQQAIEIDQSTTHNAQSVLSTARNTSYSSIQHFVRCARAANSAYSFLTTQSDPFGTPDAQHNLRGDGALLSDIAATTPADYAEYFECLEASGIEAGYAIKLNTDGLLEIAASGESIIGIVSEAPAFIADSAWSRWHDKYLKTDFGAHQLDENGDRTLNPAWNSGLEYVSREERAEWVTVGMLGKLWVRIHDEAILSGDHVSVGASGMMIKTTDQELNWLVIASGISFDLAKGYGTARILYK